MNQRYLDLQRKARVAGRLIQRGNWRGIVDRTRRNLDPILAPIAETYTLGHDALLHAYWRRRERAGASDSVSAPFIVESSRSGSPKNVVWIMLDALRQDIFDTYVRRGGLAELIENGAYFPNTFAQGSWTYPSVFSFLTGQYPFNCGVSRIAYNDTTPISLCADFDDSCPTIFSILREHDYQVASILDGWGFTVRTTAGQAHREDQYFEEHWGWMYGQDRRFLSLSELRDASVSYINEAARQGPFMLFVRSLYTHSPYRDIFPSPEYVNELSRRGWSFRLIEGFVRGMQRFETLYMQPLLTALTRAGQLENTIIVLCSDHGEMFWNLEADLRTDEAVVTVGVPDEEIWRHQLEPYNALAKVPLVIWGAPLHGTYTQRFRLLDVVPTLLDALGIAYTPTAFDGVSVGRTADRPLYADSAGYGNGGIAFQAAGAKLLSSRRLGAVAYDVTIDDYERLDLRRPAGAEIGELTTFLEQTGRTSDAVFDQDDEEVLLRRLEALGYID